jgi:hypothetical protein
MRDEGRRAGPPASGLDRPRRGERHLTAQARDGCDRPPPGEQRRAPPECGHSDGTGEQRPRAQHGGQAPTRPRTPGDPQAGDEPRTQHDPQAGDEPPTQRDPGGAIRRPQNSVIGRTAAEQGAPAERLRAAVSGEDEAVTHERVAPTDRAAPERAASPEGPGAAACEDEASGAAACEDEASGAAACEDEASWAPTCAPLPAGPDNRHLSPDRMPAAPEAASRHPARHFPECLLRASPCRWPPGG